MRPILGLDETRRAAFSRLVDQRAADRSHADANNQCHSSAGLRRTTRIHRGLDANRNGQDQLWRLLRSDKWHPWLSAHLGGWDDVRRVSIAGRSSILDAPRQSRPTLVGLVQQPTRQSSKSATDWW